MIIIYHYSGEKFEKKKFSTEIFKKDAQNWLPHLPPVARVRRCVGKCCQKFRVSVTTWSSRNGCSLPHDFHLRTHTTRLNVKIWESAKIPAKIRRCFTRKTRSIFFYLADHWHVRSLAVAQIRRAVIVARAMQVKSHKKKSLRMNCFAIVVSFCCFDRVMTLS